MAIKFSVYYYFGAYIYKKGYKPKLSTLIGSSLISVGLFGTISVFYGMQSSNFPDLLIEVLNCICSIAGIIMTYSLVVLIQDKMQFIMKTRFWQYLKRCNFGVYLFHQQIIYLTIILLNGRVHPIVQVIISFSVSVLASSAITLLLRKWKYSRTLFAL